MCLPVGLTGTVCWAMGTAFAIYYVILLRSMYPVVSWLVLRPAQQLWDTVTLDTIPHPQYPLQVKSHVFSCLAVVIGRVVDPS